MTCLHGVGHPAGERGLFAVAELREYGVAAELVVEGVPVGQVLVGHDQVVGQVVQQAQHHVVVESGDVLDDGEREPGAERGGDREQVPGAWSEAGDPAGERAGQAERGRDVGRLGERPGAATTDQDLVVHHAL